MNGNYDTSRLSDSFFSKWDIRDEEGDEPQSGLDDDDTKELDQDKIDSLLGITNKINEKVVKKWERPSPPPRRAPIKPGLWQRASPETERAKRTPVPPPPPTGTPAKKWNVKPFGTSSPPPSLLKQQTSFPRAGLRISSQIIGVLKEAAAQGFISGTSKVRVLSRKTHHHITTYELEIDGERVQLQDASRPESYNMIATHRFIESLDSKRDTINQILKARRADESVLNDLRDLYWKCHRALESAAITPSTADNEEFPEEVESACKKAAEIRADYISKACQLLRGVEGLSDFNPGLLQACENRRNATQFRKILCLYTLESGEQIIETATPLRKEMNVSAIRSDPKLSNAFERKAYLLAEGKMEPLNDTSLWTHSGLSPIGIGQVKMKKGKFAPTRTPERLAAGIKIFMQVLEEGIKKNHSSASLTDGERVEVPMSWTTLFTPVKTSVDLGKRKMEAESLSLEETALIYDLFDGTDVELHIEDKQIIAAPDIQLINLGCNYHATADSPLFKMRNAKIEDPINRLGMAKQLASCEAFLEKSGFQDVSSLSLAQRKNESSEIWKLREQQSLARHNLFLKNAELKDARVDLRRWILEGTVKDEDLESFKTKLKERDEAAQILEKCSKSLYRATSGQQKNILDAKREELSRLRKSKNDPKTLKRLEGEIDLHHLYLEMQELYYGTSDKEIPPYRTKENVYRLQACNALTGKLLNRLSGLNCKSAEDRTGAFWCFMVVLGLIRKTTGRYPALSTLFKEHPDFQHSNSMLNDRRLHQKVHEMGVSSAINNMNNPGTPGMQIGGKVNPLLDGWAKVGNLGGLSAKWDYKIASKNWSK